MVGISPLIMAAPSAVGAFSGLSLDSSTPPLTERVAMTVKFRERMEQFTSIPDRLERTTNGIAALVSIAGLIALLALAVSIVALERTHAH